MALPSSSEDAGAGLATELAGLSMSSAAPSRDEIRNGTTHATTPPGDAPFRFFDLPQELRDKIYALSADPLMIKEPFLEVVPSAQKVLPWVARLGSTLGQPSLQGRIDEKGEIGSMLWTDDRAETTLQLYGHINGLLIMLPSLRSLELAIITSVNSIEIAAEQGYFLPSDVFEMQLDQDHAHIAFIQTFHSPWERLFSKADYLIDDDSYESELQYHLESHRDNRIVYRGTKSDDALSWYGLHLETVSPGHFDMAAVVAEFQYTPASRSDSQGVFDYYDKNDIEEMAEIWDDAAEDDDEWADDDDDFS